MLERLLKRPHLICIGYHSVRPKQTTKTSYSHLVTSQENFRKQINFLVQNGYKFVSSRELTDNNEERIKENRAFIYFDDGYKDILDYALPILKEHNIRATVFITTDFISGNKNPWKEGSPFMSWDNALSHMEVFDFESHTVSHRKLHKLSDVEIEKELRDSKNIIKKKLGREPFILSYPNSSFNKLVQKIAQNTGYKITIGNGVGPNYKQTFFLKKVRPRDLEKVLQ